MNRQAARTLVIAMACLAFLAVAPSTQAQRPIGPLGPPDCQGDIEVQVGTDNHYDCVDCRGSIVVQVGLSNDADCQGHQCLGNVIVQAGLENSLDCAQGLLQSQTSIAFAPPCPPQLPENNFYCHVVHQFLPPELCLSLDFCLW